MGAAAPAAVLAALAGGAFGQCTPAWETAAGNPGIAGGYAAPVRLWNDGAGARVYVGGSFTSAGGGSANAYLAKWNPADWAWAPAGGGIGGVPWAGLASWDGATWHSLNTTIAGYSPYVGALQAFNDGSGEALYAAGRFTSIDGVAGTGLVARWRGTAWETVGGGLTSTSS